MIILPDNSELKKNTKHIITVGFFYLVFYFGKIENIDFGMPNLKFRNVYFLNNWKYGKVDL